jgi:hypothetical protein
MGYRHYDIKAMSFMHDARADCLSGTNWDAA